MKIKAQKARMEIIFPVVLFLVFTLSALFVILYSARTYQHIVEESNTEYEKSTALAYLTTKIHASDENGNIGVEIYSGLPALAIRQEIEGSVFVTYIYAYKGSLREIFTQDNGTLNSPEAGTVLFPVETFAPGLVSERLLSLTIVEDGKETTQLVTLISSGKENKL